MDFWDPNIGQVKISLVEICNDGDSSSQSICLKNCQIKQGDVIAT